MKNFLTLVAIATFAATAQASVLWDEAISGDASGDPLSPSAAPAITLGSNTFLGTVTNTAGTDQRDYITFTVPAGLQITQLIVLTLSPDNIVWTHFDDGATSVIPSAGTAGSILAGAHIPASQPDGTDVFANYQAGSAALLAGGGLSGPIGPGTYTFLMQQTSGVPTVYGLDFIAVPAPAAASALGILMFAGARRRRLA